TGPRGDPPGRVVRPVGPRPPPRPRHLAVEREADAVEQRGLARAGGAVDEEQPIGRELVKVELDGGAERPHGLDLEPTGPHDATSARAAASARVRRSASAGPAAAPSCSSQNRSVRSIGSRRRRSPAVTKASWASGTRPPGSWRSSAAWGN